MIKSMKFKLICLLIFSIFNACSMKQTIDDMSKRNGRWIWWVDKGSSQGVWITASSNEPQVENGDFISFFPNGIYSQKGTLVNGKLNGTLKVYDIEGKFIKQEFYKQDSLINEKFEEGYNRFYNEEGIMIEEGEIVGGKKNGRWKYYFDDGVLRRINDFKLGQKTGYIITYYPSGIVADSSYRIDGKQIGVAKFWYDNGALEQISNWKENVQVDSMIQFHQNGKIKEISYWRNGKQHGETNGWFENGKPHYKRHYKDGIEECLYKAWYANGNLKVIGYVRNDNPEGEWNLYHENGKLNSKGSFLRGEKKGKWVQYDANGHLQTLDNF